MRIILLWALAAALTFEATSLHTEQYKKKVVCYFSSWAIYRPDKGRFNIPDIDPSLCTHLIYAFASLSANGSIIIVDPNADLPDDGGKDGYNKFNQLRQRNPEVKTMIAIGGWNDGGSTNFSKVAGEPDLRKAFVRNVETFVQKYGFNGLDFDWEYPNQADRKNFVLLLRELRARFDVAGLLLSAAVGATRPLANHSYDIPEMHKYLDFINLMTYNYHGSWENKTGINAPLTNGSWEKGDQSLLNVNASVRYWLAQGAPAEKLVLGIALYGRSFTLDDPNNFGVGAPASKPGKAGPYVKKEGIMGYNEICENLKLSNQNWTIRFEKEQRSPYAISGDQWVGYDDDRSVQEKACLIKDMKLGGAMAWSIDTDDFRGLCGGSKYPILRLINDILRPKAPQLPTSTQNPSTSSENSTNTNNNASYRTNIAPILTCTSLLLLFILS